MYHTCPDATCHYIDITEKRVFFKYANYYKIVSQPMVFIASHVILLLVSNVWSNVLGQKLLQPGQDGVLGLASDAEA